MGNSRNDEWDENNETYSPEQVESVLESCDIEVVTDTDTAFLCFCPFHGNSDTPAFAVNKYEGSYYCFNPSCMVSGKLLDLPMKLKSMNIFKAMRLLAKARTSSSKTIEQRVAEALKKPVDFEEFPQEVLNQMKANFPGSIAEDYMHSRGFEDSTLDYFDIGFSAKKNMVVVPMHDPKGMPIGIIGRTPSAEHKVFKNSVNLPKSKTAWNFHRAKREGSTVIICEASYDAMRIHQAGYPNVVALLGGSISDHHALQLSKTFSKIIIMTDFDNKQFRPNCRQCDYKRCVGHRPGRDLARSIIAKLPNKKIMWGCYSETEVFPHSAKDASDMTDDEIRQCLKSAVTNLEYSLLNLENA